MKLIAIALLLSIGLASALPTDEGPITVTVKEKWSKVIGSGEDASGIYLFSTTDGQVYSIQDTFWHFDFEAANRYASIEPNKTYRIWLFGVRVPFLSMYQNAYQIEAVFA